ncbi:unnamed protein product, partial [Linum tenue]
INWKTLQSTSLVICRVAVVEESQKPTNAYLIFDFSKAILNQYGIVFFLNHATPPSQLVKVIESRRTRPKKKPRRRKQIAYAVEGRRRRRLSGGILRPLHRHPRRLPSERDRPPLLPPSPTKPNPPLPPPLLRLHRRRPPPLRRPLLPLPFRPGNHGRPGRAQPHPSPLLAEAHARRLVIPHRQGPEPRFLLPRLRLPLRLDRVQRAAARRREVDRWHREGQGFVVR